MLCKLAFDRSGIDDVERLIVFVWMNYFDANCMSTWSTLIIYVCILLKFCILHPNKSNKYGWKFKVKYALKIAEM